MRHENEDASMSANTQSVNCPGRANANQLKPEGEKTMLSRLTGILVLALSVGVFLAPVADAKTFKGTIHFKATYVSIGGSLSFDTADATSTAVYGVVSVNWWKSSWHQPSTSEQLTI
jgi:hypothetical protein